MAYDAHYQHLIMIISYAGNCNIPYVVWAGSASFCYITRALLQNATLYFGTLHFDTLYFGTLYFGTLQNAALRFDTLHFATCRISLL